jgi:hypothetical protein
VQFAQAIANRPLSEEQLKEARDNLEKQMNAEALLEAASVGAFFELITKVADVTGKVPMPRTMRTIIECVLSIVRFFYNLFWK